MRHITPPVPLYRTKEYIEGAEARRDGATRQECPYTGTFGNPETRRRWESGWVAEDRGLFLVFAAEAAMREKRKRSAYAERHKRHFADVANKLCELGIDPYRLRDYLVGLPDND